MQEPRRGSKEASGRRGKQVRLQEARRGSMKPERHKEAGHAEGRVWKKKRAEGFKEAGHAEGRVWKKKRGEGLIGRQEEKGDNKGEKDR